MQKTYINIKTALLILLLGISALSMAALPPNLQIDRYLLQAEKAIENKDHHKTAAIIDKIIALKDKHNLKLDVDFYFKYAQILLQSNVKEKGNKARTAIEHYLNKADNNNKYYERAFELYDEALNQQLSEVKTTYEIEQLVRLRRDINVKNENGDTLLHYAIKYNKNPDIIKTLVQLGANINAKGKDGNTPLHLAALIDENPDIIKTLVQLGADINAKNKDGNTPLHWAAWDNKNPEIIKTLVKLGIKVNAKGKDGNTPLHYAAGYNQNPDIIKTLVQLGANINAKDKDGNTPLHWAAESNKNTDIIKTLVKLKAKVNDKNGKGKIPADLLYRNGLTSWQKTEIRQLLKP